MAFENFQKLFEGGTMSKLKIGECANNLAEEALGTAILEEVVKDKEIAFQKMGCPREILSIKSADRYEELILGCVREKLESTGTAQTLTYFSSNKQTIIQKRADRFLEDARTLVERMSKGAK